MTPDPFYTVVDHVTRRHIAYWSYYVPEWEPVGCTIPVIFDDSQFVVYEVKWAEGTVLGVEFVDKEGLYGRCCTSC